MLLELCLVRSMTTPDDVHGKVGEREKQRLVVGELLNEKMGGKERWVRV